MDREKKKGEPLLQLSQSLAPPSPTRSYQLTGIVPSTQKLQKGMATRGRKGSVASRGCREWAWDSPSQNQEARPLFPRVHWRRPCAELHRGTAVTKGAHHQVLSSSCPVYCCLPKCVAPTSVIVHPATAHVPCQCLLTASVHLSIKGLPCPALLRLTELRASGALPRAGQGPERLRSARFRV